MVPRESRVIDPWRVETVADFYKEAWDDADAHASGRLRGVSTGFPRLDGALSGLHDVTVLGGLPGIGKTTLAFQIGWQAAEQGAAVIYVSAEMHAADLRARLVAMLRAQSGAAAKREFKSVGRRVAILDGPSASVEDAKKEMAALKKQVRSKRGLVVIDSLQALALARRTHRRERDEMKGVIDREMAQVRETAHKGGFAALVISHMPKGTQGRVEQFTFSGSGGIDYGADVTALLVADEGEEEGATRVGRRVEFLKNRFGSLASLRFTFYPAEHRYEELSP